jgi:hypothetical protein
MSASSEHLHQHLNVGLIERYHIATSNFLAYSIAYSFNFVYGSKP